MGNETRSIESSVFRQRGRRLSIENPRIPPTPTEAEKLAFAAKLKIDVPQVPGSVFARLTPAAPTIPDRAALVLTNVSKYEGGQAYAEFHSVDEMYGEKLRPEERGFVSLWLKSPAGPRSLVDFAVGDDYPTGSSKPPLGWKLDGEGQSTMATSGDVPHAVLDAETAGWFHLRISGVGIGWTFYWCEVTNL